MVWKIYTLTFEKNLDNKWHIGIANYVNREPVDNLFGELTEEFIKILKPHLKKV